MRMSLDYRQEFADRLEVISYVERARRQNIGIVLGVNLDCSFLQKTPTGICLWLHPDMMGLRHVEQMHCIFHAQKPCQGLYQGSGLGSPMWFRLRVMISTLLFVHARPPPKTPMMPHTHTQSLTCSGCCACAGDDNDGSAYLVDQGASCLLRLCLYPGIAFAIAFVDSARQGLCTECMVSSSLSPLGPAMPSAYLMYAHEQ